MRMIAVTLCLLVASSISAEAQDAVEDDFTDHNAEAASAETPGPDPAYDVRRISRDDDQYTFMRLGRDADYLTAERARIADQIQQFIPPLYEPVLPFHAYTLPPGAMRIKIGSSIFNNDRDFGRDDFYSLFFSDIKVRNTIINYDFSYGFEVPQLGALGRDLVINLDLPYRRTSIRGTGHPWRIDPFVMTMNADVEGVGDLTITLKKKWLDQANAGFNLATVTGVITPTGHHREMFNDVQSLMVGGMPMPAPPIDIFGSQPGERFVPNDAQPGRGAWGGRVGVMATRQFERSALHAGVVGQFYAKNEDDITPGDELRFGASYVFPIFPKTDVLALDLSVFGRAKEEEHFPGTVMHPERDPATGGPIMDSMGNLVMFTTPKPTFEHGTVVFFQPSLIFAPTPQTRLTVSPAFRVLEPDQGPSPKFMISSSIEVTF